MVDRLDVVLMLTACAWSMKARYTYLVCVFAFFVLMVVVIVSVETALRFGMIKSNIGVIRSVMTTKYGVSPQKNVVG